MSCFRPIRVHNLSNKMAFAVARMIHKEAKGNRKMSRDESNTNGGIQVTKF